MDQVKKPGVSRPHLDQWVTSVTDPPTRTGHVAAWALDLDLPIAPVVRVLPSLAALPPRTPEVNELFLWFGAPVSENAERLDSADLAGHLSKTESQRAVLFHNAADHWSFAIVHAGLRALLASCLGCSATEISFVTGRQGKPMLDPARHGKDAATLVQFNISHTRGLVAVAIAGRAVGVDVERPRSMSDMSVVAKQVMAREALLSLDAADDDADRALLFFRFWTLGEAFIKATGEGLAQGLNTFAFTGRGAPRLLRVSEGWGPISRWRLGLMQA